jgi:hypothetical protein
MAKAKAPEANEPEAMILYYGDQEYRIDDLAIGDIAEMEEEFDESIENIDFGRKKAIIWITWLVRRTKEPNLTLEEVAKTPIRDLMDASGDASDEAPLEEGSKDV